MGSSTGRSLVVVVTGTSGAGKGTLEKLLLARMPELELAVSATTREQRPGEQNGREYWFISADEFEERVQKGEFLEYVDLPWGARSGTLRSEIDRIQELGKVPLLDLETEGALRVQESIPGSVTFFVDAPTFEELERRLRERATESSGEIQVRLTLAQRAAATPRPVRLRNCERRGRAGRRRAHGHRQTGAPDRRYHEPPMIHPRIDELLDNVDSRYALVIVAAKRARQINDYHHQLGEGIGFEQAPPPLIESRSKNYLTMALEEVAEGKLKYKYPK